MSVAKKDTNVGVGIGTSTAAKSTDEHPGGPVQHGAVGQAERAFSAASTFLSGVLA